LFVLECFDFIELILNESMDGFYIGLPCVRAWGDGGVRDAVKGMNGFCETGVVSGVPRANEFGSIVSLSAGAFKMHVTGLQMAQDDMCEEGGIAERPFFCISDELGTA